MGCLNAALAAKGRINKRKGFGYEMRNRLNAALAAKGRITMKDYMVFDVGEGLNAALAAKGRITLIFSRITRLTLFVVRLYALKIILLDSSF